MQCPKCQAEVPEGAAFCPACGEAQAAPEPTASDDYAAKQAAYEAELAEYQWKRAAYEQELAAQQAPPAYPTATPPATPPKKSKTGLVIGIIALVLVLLAACGVGGVFVVRALGSRMTKTETPDLTDESRGDTPDQMGDELSTGFATAEDALVARLGEDGIADWVYEIAEEGDGFVVYWAGPPNSEWVTAYRIEQADDDSWAVGDVSDIASDEGTGDAAGEAEQTVWEYLTAVYEDRGLDAQGWTVSPFSEDSASAQVSAGGLTDFWLEQTAEQADGSYWVQTTQTWYGEPQNWQYWVVPTEAGYRIADVQPW